MSFYTTNNQYKCSGQNCIFIEYEKMSLIKFCTFSKNKNRHFSNVILNKCAFQHSGKKCNRHLKKSIFSKSATVQIAQIFDSIKFFVDLSNK